MNGDMKKLILRALSTYEGDDLIRAQRAFSNMTPEQMQEQHGCGGQTRQQIMDAYYDHSRACTEARAWVERQL